MREKKRWEVLLPETIHPAGPRTISDIATFTSRGEYDTLDDLIRNVGRFDALIVRTEEVSAAVIEAATDLKIVAKHGAGVDNIDIGAATENGVVVCNTPTANSRSVAEHALTLLMTVCKQVVKADSQLRQGRWERSGVANREISETTLGLFGCGNIGRKVVARANGLDMECVVYDPYVDEDDLPSYVETVPSKSELFETADHVSVHAPLTEDTRHAISTAKLRRLPTHGILVNTSRGEIVDEDALLDALESGAIRGAGLDVFAVEPIPDDHPLLDVDTVVLTPHLAGITEEAMRRMSTQAAANVRTVYEGRVPRSTLNRDELDNATLSRDTE